MSAEFLELPAPAKLNLFLHVTGRRADGYHLLETVFEMIDLCDRVSLRLREDGRIERETSLPGVDPEHDLTVRAAKLLAERTGCRLGASIGLDKRIPMGGGLGGGSSDAATVLIGLNRMWSLGLKRDELMALGLTLGADVPFFIYGQTAYATGVGEELQACPQPDRHYVLIAPAAGVATPRVFADPGLTRDSKPLKIFGLLRGESVFRGRNDLEAVAIRIEPTLEACLSALRRAAKTALAAQQFERLAPFETRPEWARMSGSGSTVFLPVSEHLADAIVQCLLSSGELPPGAQVLTARSITRHPLRDWI